MGIAHDTLIAGSQGSAANSKTNRYGSNRFRPAKRPLAATVGMV